MLDMKPRNLSLSKVTDKEFMIKHPSKPKVVKIIRETSPNKTYDPILSIII